MTRVFKVGDHVEWNSEAGRVRGSIKREIISRDKVQGLYDQGLEGSTALLIKSDKVDHMAMHKGSDLKKLRESTSKRSSSYCGVADQFPTSPTL